MNTATQNKNQQLTTLRITLVAALGGLLFGYDTGVISGSQLYFSEYFNFNAVQKGDAVSSALYGCLIGALVGGYLTKHISRKYTLILSAVLFTVSAWGSGIADNLTELVIYRIIGGLGVGMASLAAPMYIAEVSPPKDRGRMVSYYQLAVVIGFFTVFLATYFIGGGDTQGLTPDALEELRAYNVSQGWRVMFWSELVPAVAFLVLLFTVPHSPRWLMIKGRIEEAKSVLSRIASSEKEAQAELSEISESLSKDPSPKMAELFAKGIGFALFLGVMLSIFQQITGINAILYYQGDIFANALGYEKEDALGQQLWVGAVNLIFTFIAIYTVDSWGRKPLFILGTIGMFLGLSTLGLTIYTQELGVISLLAMLLFIASFAMSMGPVVWVILSEMFPNNVRSVAMSIAVAAQWLFNALVAKNFPLVNESALNQNAFNGALPYFIFAFFCVIAMFFVWKLVPETKGKTLEEMEELWRADS